MGLALAGGGPVGAIYELGALRAIDESITGLRLHDLDVYVGVSAGGVIAASLANHISSAEICRIFMGHSGAEYAFDPEKLLKPAYREYLSRAATLPGIITDSLINIVRNPTQASASKFMSALGKAIPSGIFDNHSLHDFITRVFEATGGTNDFRELKRKLYIVAVELDNGAAVRFGAPGLDHVPISRAVQASAALPGLYPPVKIEGQFYVDGALRRTLHASAALDEGVDLLLAVNPLVPFDAAINDDERHLPARKLIEGGLPLILSQTFRALIQSRMNVGFRGYQKSHPKADLLLAEPNRQDEQMFFANIFSFASRKALCNHAFQGTRKDLLSQADHVDKVLSRHGMALNRERLADTDRTLEDSLNESFHGHSKISRRLNRALEDLEWQLRERTTP